jgi:hypothetical protein
MLEIILLIVGIGYAIRRPSLKRLTAGNYPGVDEAQFAAWHRQQLRAVNIFLGATWGALAVKLVILAVLSGSRLSQETALTWTIVILVAWIIGLLIAAGASSEAKRLRTAAGISWPAPPVVAGAPPLPAASDLAGLRQGLCSADPTLRHRCASAIGDLGAAGAEALPDLEKLRADPSRRVSDRATWAIETIQEKLRKAHKT